MTAAADQTVLVLDSEKAAPTLVKMRERFVSELGLVLDAHALQRERVPADFTLSDDGLREVRARLDGRASAALFTELVDDALVVTIIVPDGRRMLTRTAQAGADDLDSLALSVRELLATSYGWDPEARGEVAKARPETEASPPPPEEPLGPHAVFVTAGAVRSNGQPAFTLASFAGGAQHALPNHLELRELVEAAHGTTRGVKRLVLNARVDAGYRLGDGLFRVVPMVTARLGWQRTQLGDEATYGGVLARVGGALELRARLSERFELSLRPEASWNIAPLRVERVSSGAVATDDGDLIWGGALGLACYF